MVWGSSDKTVAYTEADGTAFANTTEARSCLIKAYDAVSGVLGTVPLQVTGANVTSLTLSPTNASIPVGGSQAYNLTATFSDSTTMDVSRTSYFEAEGAYYIDVNLFYPVNASVITKSNQPLVAYGVSPTAGVKVYAGFQRIPPLFDVIPFPQPRRFYTTAMLEVRP